MVNVYGEGEQSVVLIHGLAGLFNSWEGIVPELSRHFRIYEMLLPDCRDMKEGFGIEDYHNHLVEMFGALRLRHAAVIGHSLGGQIAARLAATQEVSVSALVLVASSGLQTESDRIRRVLYKQPSKANLPQILKTIFHDPAPFLARLVDSAHTHFSDRSRFRGLIRTVRKLKGDSLEAILAQIEVPTLLVWGRDDEITPVNLAEEFRRRIRRAEVAIFPECGHAPQIEHPMQFNKLVVDFLQSAMTMSQAG